MLEESFISSLDSADKVVVLAIYAAREADPGYSAKAIVDELPSGKGHYLPDFDQAIAFLSENLQPADVAIVFSAGDATEISQAVLENKKHMESRSIRTKPSNG